MTHETLNSGRLDAQGFGSGPVGCPVLPVEYCQSEPREEHFRARPHHSWEHFPPVRPTRQEAARASHLADSLLHPLVDSRLSGRAKDRPQSVDAMGREKDFQDFSEMGAREKLVRMGEHPPYPVLAAISKCAD